ncbi:hypothetical protein [Bailinhaonella thermotolerans]|uniref:Uncharacterized protein n=1 Tax=Bailinhaonella thermotolerans TaxID=1070861 RepID=A0A3A3ZY75_9ACTN|nr:hypothetical protein [Bailinhaonella thermotolerans]RJL19747.1 hypothetical protein D5H75_40180 [Bailinhaonella thermotolerans]
MTDDAHEPGNAPFGQIIQLLQAAERVMIGAAWALHRAHAPRLPGYRAHRRRCRICNPAGFPPALAADRGAYLRRVRRRRRC